MHQLLAWLTHQSNENSPEELHLCMMVQLSLISVIFYFFEFFRIQVSLQNYYSSCISSQINILSLHSHKVYYFITTLKPKFLHCLYVSMCSYANQTDHASGILPQHLVKKNVIKLYMERNTKLRWVSLVSKFGPTTQCEWCNICNVYHPFIIYHHLSWQPWQRRYQTSFS